MMRFILLAVLVAISGCASQSEQNTASLRTPAPVADSAPASNSEPKAAVPAEKRKEFKPPAGYKKRIHDGTVVYCAKIVVLGSRFPKEDCRTQAGLEELAMQRAGVREEMDQRRRVCASAPGCASN